MSLDKKYRPKDFDEVIGQDLLIESLEGMLKKKRKPSAYLLHGPKGCGKTTIARIMKKYLKADAKDFHELNISSMRGIDTARKIISNVKFKPMGGESKVIVLNECHMATTEFQNAVLEEVEEPPKNVYFILVTTEPERIIGTLRSRCVLSQFPLRRLRNKDLRKVLKRIMSKEKIKLKAKLVTKIMEVADGCPREAILALEAIAEIEDEDIMLDILDEYTSDAEGAIKLCRALSRGKPWKEIREILRTVRGGNPEDIRRRILNYFNAILLDKGGFREALVIEQLQDSVYDTGFAGLTKNLYLVCQDENYKY